MLRFFVYECVFLCLFLPQCLGEAGEDDDATKMSEEDGEKGESTQETEGQKEEHQSKDEKDLLEDEEKMEDSPVLGLLKEQKGGKQETKIAEGNGKKIVPNEALIKKAIKKRTSYLKANAEYVVEFSNYSLFRHLCDNAHILSVLTFDTSVNISILFGFSS